MTVDFFRTEAEVERFLQGVKRVVSLAFVLAVVGVLSFFTGLALIGKVKKYYAYPDHTVRYVGCGVMGCDSEHTFGHGSVS